MQESIKAGIIRSPELFRFLEQHRESLLDVEHPKHSDDITRVVSASVRVKAGVVASDERESGVRMILNFGHTLGHAIEAATGYKHLLHGEAVAVGLGLAFRLSSRLGYCAPETATRVANHLEAVGLPSEPGMLNRRFSANRIIAAMKRDKKMRDGRLHFVLARGIGEAFTSGDVPEGAVVDLLRDEGLEA